MSQTTDGLVDLVKQLPADLQREVRNFAEYLLDTKVDDAPSDRLSLDWAGGLRDLSGQVTSLELQKNALEWWGD